VEALAAAALGDTKAEAAAQAGQTIDFECPQCGEAIKMSRDLAGKNAPCPECRRIIKVPVPKTKEGADWRRKDDTLPSGARRDTEPAPEGAWEPSRAKGVSAEALIEAGVVKKKKRPGLTRRQKVYRWTAGVTVAVVALVGGLFAWSAWSQNKQGSQVDKAVKAAEDQAAKTKEPAAEANRAAGEYVLRAGGHDTAEKAQKLFGKARDLLSPPKSPPGPEADLLLADLAVSQVDLGGGDDEARAGTRLKWDKALAETKATLGHVSSAAGRLHALHLVSRKLIARGRSGDAIQLAAQAAANKAGAAEDPDAASEGPEALAVVGIELFRAGQKEDAGKLAARASQPYAGPADGPDRPPLSPSAVALALALGKPEPKAAKEDDGPAYAAGRAAGLALKGEPAAARDVPKDLPPEARLRALVMLAEATGEAADVDAAAKPLDGEVRANEPGVPWLVYRLAVAAARAGQADGTLKLAERAADPGLKARAQLEAVRARLEGTRDAAGDGALQGIGTGATLQALAHEALARHNGRLDYAGTVKAAEGWDEAVRPFGVLGAVLGEQDAKGK
jgi:hypothetical protein